MKFRISATLLLTMFLSMLQAHAQADWQSDIEAFDAHRWNSETMINACIKSGAESLSGYILAAYIDGELRGYVDTPTTLPNGQSLYSLRVKGDEADCGKSISLAIIDTAESIVYSGDDIAVSTPLTWTGETIGLPSSPVIVRILGNDIAVESIAVKEGVAIWRGDYDMYSPLVLNDYFTVLPEDATDKTVSIVLADEYAAQGSLAYNKYVDRWEFTPAASCKGKVDFIISSVSTPEVTAKLTITVRVKVESMSILMPIVNMAVGETLDITDYFTILPEDADNREAVVESLNPDIVSVETTEYGKVTITALAAGYADIKVSAIEAPELIYDFIAVNVGATLAGLNVDIYPCDDDIIDEESGDITKLRQSIYTQRALSITPYPEGAIFDPGLLGYEISLDTSIPSSWSATADEGFTDANVYGALLSFTPAVPGVYTLKITYDGNVAADSEGKELVFHFPVIIKDILLPGWNWISSPIAYNGPSLSDALENPESMIEARTQNHFLINDPEIGYYAGFKDSEGNYTNEFTLDSTTDLGHFRVKMAEEAEEYTLRYDGGYDFTTPSWLLNNGWTWVNNPLPYDFDISTLNNPLYAFTDGDVIKSDFSMATFTDGAWVGPLTVIEAGRGYSVMSGKARKVAFNCGAFEQTRPSKRSRVASRFMESMAMIALIEGADTESRVEVYADGELRGRGEYIADRWFIMAAGEPADILTIEVTGCDGVKRSGGKHAFSPMVGSYGDPISLTLDDDDIRVEGATIIGSVTAIFDPCGRDVTAANGHLSPGIYIAAGNNTVRKVTVK